MLSRRLAGVRPPWNHNIHYHDLVLAAVAPGCGCALDVGCGQGLLARRLAERCGSVIGIDIDAEALAAARSIHGTDRVAFILGDVMKTPFAEGSFALITVVASLHHLPLAPALLRFERLLRPGGLLVAIGLFRAHGIADFLAASVALPTSLILRRLRNYVDVGAPLQGAAETLPEIRTACGAALPGAILRRHLLFRYSLIWRKP